MRFVRRSPFCIFYHIWSCDLECRSRSNSFANFVKGVMLMLSLKFHASMPLGSWKEDFLKIFTKRVTVTLNIGQGQSRSQTLKVLTQGSFLPSFVEIHSAVRKKKSFKAKKSNDTRHTTQQTTHDRRHTTDDTCGIRIAHMSLWLRWAKN